MRAWTTDLEGSEVTTAFYPESTVVCELLSFFKRVPSPENIQALTNCTTLYITFADLQTAFHSLHEFREFGRTILVNSYAALKQRMLSGLHETAEQRYKNLITAAPEIFQHASLKHIASFLGVTDTSLSRIRKEFSKEH
jgi:CRP-like cAMP-binding protein